MGTYALEINIMRKLIIATSLALCPIVLQAQATSPAQPKTSATLQSKLVEPMLGAAAGVNHPATVRVSTGVVAPKLIHTVSVTSDEGSKWSTHRTSTTGSLLGWSSMRTARLAESEDCAVVRHPTG